MGAITYDMENTSSIPAGKLFKAFLLDSDNLIPKILPQAFKSVEILEGDGGAGTIKLITFGEGSQFKSVKHRVDSIDKENLTYSYSIIEGDALMDILESITYHIKIVPTADGGSICVMVASAYGAIIFNLPKCCIVTANKPNRMSLYSSLKSGEKTKKLSSFKATIFGSI